MFSSYTHVKKTSQDLQNGNLILVNNTYLYQKNVSTDDFKQIFGNKPSSYSVRDKNVYLQAECLEHFNAFIDDFERQTGNNRIMIISGFRSVQTQKQLYREKADKVGKEAAAIAVAKPYGSEHHTGLAIDLSLYDRQKNKSHDYTGKGVYSWIEENAPRYGFILRYTKEKTSVTGIMDEPWHYRYVGLPHSLIIQKNNFCLEEYINYLKQFEYDQSHLNYTYNHIRYEIYFVPANRKRTSVPVPQGQDYTVSGNNTDGFIVTVSKT